MKEWQYFILKSPKMRLQFLQIPLLPVVDLVLIFASCSCITNKHQVRADPTYGWGWIFSPSAITSLRFPRGRKGISHISQSHDTTEAGPERRTAVVIGQETPQSYFRRSHTYEALREGKFRHCLGISLSRFLVYGFLFVSLVATRKL